MYKQIIIARKDLNMSSGKLAAQVSHASMAFLTNKIRNSFHEVYSDGERYVKSELKLDLDLFNNWVNGSFTKCILEAKNKYQLEKSITMANEMGLIEGKDYFIIRDNCLTELQPEEPDGRTITCVGFAPMPSDKIDKIGKKYQLWK